MVNGAGVSPPHAYIERLQSLRIVGILIEPIVRVILGRLVVLLLPRRAALVRVLQRRRVQRLLGPRWRRHGQLHAAVYRERVLVLLPQAADHREVRRLSAVAG